MATVLSYLNLPQILQYSLPLRLHSHHDSLPMLLPQIAPVNTLVGQTQIRLSPPKMCRVTQGK